MTRYHLALDRKRARRRCAVSDSGWASRPLNLRPARERRISRRVWDGVRYLRKWVD